MNTINNKYKTSMCKHFEQSGHCPLGPKCHFAHGNEELRNINDPLPNNMLLKQSVQSTPKPFPTPTPSSLPPTIMNYKTAKCKFFEKGFCKYQRNCGFAHGDHELRSQNSPLPQNVISASLPTNNMAAPVYEPTAQNQIAQQQIFYLIGQMQTYHANNPELLSQIKQAFEINTMGNVQASASIVYNIINRPEKSKEDSDNYASFVQNMQGIGPSLYQQMQYSQPASSLGLFGFNQLAMPTNPLIGMNPTLTPQMNMNASFNPITNPTTMVMPPTGAFENPHYKENTQNNYTGQGNTNNQGINDAMGHLEANASITMAGLTNLMGNLQGLGAMPNFNPHPMNQSTNASNNKNFGS